MSLFHKKCHAAAHGGAAHQFRLGQVCSRERAFASKVHNRPKVGEIGCERCLDQVDGRDLAPGNPPRQRCKRFAGQDQASTRLNMAIRRANGI